MDLVPTARLLQVRTDQWEVDLWHLALDRHPRCKWWWGIRSERNRAWAQCYYCDATLGRWSRMKPRPIWLGKVVDGHRGTHRHLVD